MDAREFKKLARLLALPSGGKPLGNDSWSWSKRGGYAGEKTVQRVKQAALAAGWVPSDRSGASPDGSTISHGTGLVSPEGHKLSTSASYGGTKADNRFSIYLTLAPTAATPAVEGRVRMTYGELCTLLREAVSSGEEDFTDANVTEATLMGREVLKEGVTQENLQQYLMNAGFSMATAYIAAQKARS